MAVDQFLLELQLVNRLDAYEIFTRKRLTVAPPFMKHDSRRVDVDDGGKEAIINGAIPKISYAPFKFLSCWSSKRSISKGILLP